MIGAGSYLVAVIVVVYILPVVNEVPDTFPAVVLWHPLVSFGMQLIMWLTIGLVSASTERTFANPGSRLANGQRQHRVRPA